MRLCGRQIHRRRHWQAYDRTAEAPGDAPELTLQDLRAGTAYSTRLRPVSIPIAPDFLVSEETIQAATEEEYWRILTATWDRTPSVIQWAGPQLDGKIQLYYNPLPMQEMGVKIGELVAPAADSIVATQASLSSSAARDRGGRQDPALHRSTGIRWPNPHPLIFRADG